MASEDKNFRVAEDSIHNSSKMHVNPEQPLTNGATGTNGTPSDAAILMLGDVVHAHDEFKQLSKVARFIHINSGTRAEFLAKCRNGELDGVRAISRTVESAQYTGLFDPELVEALPSSVKFISHNGAGYDQINVPACTERGITVSNTPGTVDDATADMALFLMLGAMRKAWIAQSAVREGKWRGHAPLGRDPREKTLGILGMGGIGTAVARRAAAFGFRIQYYNRRPVEKLSEKLPTVSPSPAYVSFEELLTTSDVISIHLPLGPKTRHTIGKEQFALMKRGVVIVNTARGAIIDEEALVAELQAKDSKIASVGLDVFENEPEIQPKLLTDDRIMLLPHIGTFTSDTQKRMETQVIDNVINAIQKDALLNPVN